MAPNNPQMLAGIDEAGRGCLAGPVVAAAVILPAVYNLPGLNDSKKLSAKKRSILSVQIKAQAIAWSIGFVWQRRIDQINILQASLEAMGKAASLLKVLPDCLHIDGTFTIPIKMLNWRDKPLPQQKAIEHGDQDKGVISAASILAKTCRDKFMIALARKWPEYGFERNMGYGTKEHRQALSKYGPCKAHRLSFHCVSSADNPKLYVS